MYGSSEPVKAIRMNNIRFAAMISHPLANNLQLSRAIDLQNWIDLSEHS